MRRARVLQKGKEAGVLEELEAGRHYRFSYLENYVGDPVSLTMPTRQRVWEFDRFPPVFEGLLPEGFQLDALLRRTKIDRNDLFAQLIEVGEDTVGSLTIEGMA